MKPRLAHVISSRAGIGGAERVLLSIIREASVRQFPQIVVDLFAASGDTQLRNETLGFAEHRVLAGAGLDVLRRRADLQSLLSEFNPDIVHSHLFHATAVVATLPRRKYTRVMTHHHGNLYLLRGRRIRRAVDRWTVHHHDVVVAASHFGSRVLIEEYGLPPSRLQVIPSGWVGRPATPRHRDPNLILCVANLRQEKNHEVLLRALSRVKPQFPQVRLRLVGDGPRASDLRKLTAKLGLTANVDWAGSVEDVWPHYAEASLFVMPSRVEQMGIAVVEAMAAGLPVIVSNVGGMRDLVDEQVGQTFHSDNDEELANAISFHLINPVVGRARGAEGRKRALKFKMATSIDRYFEIYESITNSTAKLPASS
ncbi:MAG TPA: glycosyltransferase family 4 protein [Actinomycetota bacterium]|nr:glycosyltransferase family 4 protein [Actinomycetota bacterium]